ncbi:hypothetical protein QOT17_025166 [Balamuthia mandrillaris]
MPSKEQTADRDDQSTDCNLQRKKQATISTALKPAYQLLTKGKDNPLIFQSIYTSPLSMFYPENLWHYALISQINDPLAQH